MSGGNMSFQSGSYTSDGNARTIDLVSGVDVFELYNFTQQGSAGVPQLVKRATWFRGMADDAAMVVRNTSGAATDESSNLTTGGFTLVDQSQRVLSSVAITGVTQANPAVVTTGANHGLVSGDKVRLSGVTGMLNLSGMEFSVTVTGPTTFSIPIDSSAFTTPGTGGTVEIMVPDGSFVPDLAVVVGISQAASAVVSTSTNHGFSVGMKVRMSVPSGMGMVEMDGRIAEITAVTATTFTIDVNSLAFSAFVFPIASAFVAQFAQANGFGEAGAALSDSVDNALIRGIKLGATIVGAASDVMFWKAYKSEAIQS